MSFGSFRYGVGSPIRIGMLGRNSMPESDNYITLERTGGYDSERQTNCVQPLARVNSMRVWHSGEN